jgi:hypothetical protein
MSFAALKLCTHPRAATPWDTSVMYAKQAMLETIMGGVLGRQPGTCYLFLNFGAQSCTHDQLSNVHF